MAPARLGVVGGFTAHLFTTHSLPCSPSLAFQSHVMSGKEVSHVSQQAATP